MSAIHSPPFTFHLPKGQVRKKDKERRSGRGGGGAGERWNKGHTWALFLLLCRWPLEKVNGTRSAAIAIASSAGSGIRNPESEIRSPATHRCCTEKNYSLTEFSLSIKSSIVTHSRL